MEKVINWKSILADQMLGVEEFKHLNPSLVQTGIFYHYIFTAGFYVSDELENEMNMQLSLWRS